jgi:PST family polysaccharide transporter
LSQTVNERTVKPEVPSPAEPLDAAVPAANGNGALPESEQQKHLCTEHLRGNLKHRTVSSGIVTVGSQGFQFFLNMVSITVLARLLSPRDFGLVAMVTTVVGFLQAFKDAGLSAATIQKEGITHAQVSNLFWINIGLSGLVSLCFACAAPLIAGYYREDLLIPITLAIAPTFLLSGSSAQHLALLNRRMQFTRVAFIQSGAMTIGVTIGIVMAAMKFRYWSLVGMNMGTAVATFVLTWFSSPWRPQKFTPRSNTKPLVNFGASLAMGQFLHTLSRGVDCLLVGRYFGPEMTGIYTRGTILLTRPLDQIMAALNTVFVPPLSRLQNEAHRYRTAFLRAFEALALMSYPLTAVFLALAHPLTHVVLGSKFDRAATIFASFTLVALFYPLNSAASWLFSTQGRGRESLVGFFFSSSITVLAYLAGLHWGPVWIARSYSIACLFLLLPIRFYLAGRRGPVTTKDLWAGYVRYLPLWFVVWSVTCFLRTTMLNANPYKQVLLCGPVGFIAGAAFLWIIPSYRERVMELFAAVAQFRKMRKAKAA